MIKGPFDKTADMQARNDNIAAPPIPVASLLYFTGIPEASKYNILNNVLLLTHSEMSDTDSFITGQAINVPVRKKFGQLLQEFNHACHAQNQFLPIWQGGIGRFGVEDRNIVNMLVRKSANIAGKAEIYKFGPFALYFPGSPIAADNIVRRAQGKYPPEPLLMIAGETVLEKSDIRELQAGCYCHMTPASHEAVFHPNAQERVRIAFPHLFAGKPGGGAPSAPKM